MLSSTSARYVPPRSLVNFRFYDPILSRQRVAYVYRAKREIQGSKIRVIWGCVYSSRIV